MLKFIKLIGRKDSILIQTIEEFLVNILYLKILLALQYFM